MFRSQPESRKQSNIEKQVAMEEAAVSGLLSTLNEDAKEDILLEELDNAMEKASSSKTLDRQISHENEESDYLYYSHPSTSSRVFSREESSGDMEIGKNHDFEDWSLQ